MNYQLGIWKLIDKMMICAVDAVNCQLSIIDSCRLMDRSSIAPMSPGRVHRCQARKTKELQLPDIVSAVLIFLSVFITLVEACYISQTGLRLFANWAQAVFAACFCTQQGYNLYQFVSQRESSVTESVEIFFTRDKDAFWHVFDVILNIVSILDIFVDTWEGRFVHGLAAMRVVRAFRLFRIFASNKFLNDFSRVMHTALLQMVNFCLVIVLSLILASVVATNMLWDFPNEQIAESYGDLGTTMWTLFKIMTMDGWTGAIQPCLELHPSLLYFFALFVFFSLSSISIVPAIFIELLIEERDKRKLEKQRKRRRKKRAVQRAISMKELNQDYESSNSSCDSSSEAEDFHGNLLRQSSLGNPSETELWIALNSLLVEWQKGRVTGASWSPDGGDCHDTYHEYNALPSSSDDFPGGYEPELRLHSTSILDLQKDVHTLHQRLIEKLEHLELEMIHRFDLQVQKAIESPSNSIEPVTQPERSCASQKERENSSDLFEDPHFWRETSQEVELQRHSDPPPEIPERSEEKIFPLAASDTRPNDENPKQERKETEVPGDGAEGRGSAEPEARDPHQHLEPDAGCSETSGAATWGVCGQYLRFRGDMYFLCGLS